MTTSSVLVDEIINQIAEIRGQGYPSRLIVLTSKQFKCLMGTQHFDSSDTQSPRMWGVKVQIGTGECPRVE